MDFVVLKSCCSHTLIGLVQCRLVVWDTLNIQLKRALLFRFLGQLAIDLPLILTVLTYSIVNQYDMSIMERDFTTEKLEYKDTDVETFAAWAKKRWRPA